MPGHIGDDATSDDVAKSILVGVVGSRGLMLTVGYEVCEPCSH